MDAAEFRGKVIGYIITEIVLAIFTAGIFTEVKWVSFVLSKLGKAGEEILLLINKAREIIGKELRAAKYADELKRLRKIARTKKLGQFKARIPKEVLDKIPKKFVEKPNKKGIGWRWLDPDDVNSGVRIDEGNPSSQFRSQQVDHVVINDKGKTIGKNGKPISGSIKSDAIEAHIPLSEYKNWKSWNTQN